ncbi:hypothetical protein Tco_1096050 [Tanacetum coccineum]
MHPSKKENREGGQIRTAITPDQRNKAWGKRGEHAKATKKGEKAMAIFMVQPWQRITRQNTTHSFSAGREISFPPIASSGGQENPIVIEAEVEGHLIHRMYVDGGSASKVLYEH